MNHKIYLVINNIYIIKIIYIKFFIIYYIKLIVDPKEKNLRKYL